MQQQQEYLKALLTLFNKSEEDIVDIAFKNKNTISTIELCYLCYNKNLLPVAFQQKFDYTKFLSYISTKADKRRKAITIDDVVMTKECCHFIDKFIDFVKLRAVSESKKQKANYYSSYIAYLFLTDKLLTVHEAVVDCLSVDAYKKVLNAVEVKLAELCKIPTDEIFSNYGRFLTNPFDSGVSPCYNRDKEIINIVDILCRKNKNNPLLVGQPGVGKTAIVYGLAYLIMSTKCPKHLENYHIFELSVSYLLSGAMYRGDVEKRLTAFIETIIDKCPNVIIFIDEIHTIMNGKNNESSDTSGVPIADILKPYMTGHGLKIIGATTEQEFKSMEKDGAILRRFNKVSIKEPPKKDVLHLMESICMEYETYFNRKCSKEILKTVVDYADLYIPNKYMPDKVIDLLDQSFVHCKNHSDRQELNEHDIIRSIESITNVSVPVPNKSVTNKISNIITTIKDNLVGQDTAVNLIENLLKRYFMGMSNPNKPIGSFLFVGPTGVGKTALCKLLATNLFNTESFVKLDMSEYMEKHAVAKLIGAPPGYVGHGKGGKLTEIVKHNPYSLILFDEIEKAHTDIYNILLQILDEGVLTDSEGCKINFKNCIIVLTSNVGATNVRDKANNTVGFGDNTLSNKDIRKIYESSVKKHFSPEFINRLDDIVYFNSLSKDDIANVVDIELNKVVKKFDNIKIHVEFLPHIKQFLYDKCFKPEYGARFVQREISKLIETNVINYTISNNLVGENINITIALNDDDEVIVTQTELDAVLERVV